MEEKRWKEVRAIIRQVARRKSSREVLGDGEIAEMYYWSVVQTGHKVGQRFESWPIHLRRGRSRLKELCRGGLQRHGLFDAAQLKRTLA